MIRTGLAIAAAVLALGMSERAAVQPSHPLSGRWQYLQPPDTAGEVLDLSLSSSGWRGVMNGLERAGEHGLFYYVVEVENLAVDSGGGIHFEVGERFLSNRRPPLSTLGGKAESGVNRYRMRFDGRLESGELVLRCTDRGGSCPDSTLRFRRMSAGKRQTAAMQGRTVRPIHRFLIVPAARR